MTLLEMRHVGVAYRNCVVIDDLNLRLEAGERVALVGPNGCGKSTLLRAIVGEYVVRSGVMLHSAAHVEALATEMIVARGVGYLRQSRNVFPSLTGTENLSLATLGCGGIDPARQKRLMEAFPDLAGIQDKRAGLLSGGQRQLLAVAMILSRPVSLLLLDEPLAGLAQRSALALMEGLAVLQREEGFGMLIVEHRVKLVQPYVNRVIIMNRGTVVVDTEDVSILSDRSRLQDHYAL